MVNKITPQVKSRSIKLFGLLAGLGAVVLILFFSAGFFTVLYSDWKGSHRSITNVADLDGDSDLDVIVGHTRWESADISWAGISLWINQGGGQFVRGDQELPGGFSAAAGDVDGDNDADLLVLDGYGLMLSINQGGAQAGQAGVFKNNNSIRPSNLGSGHADMGGSIILGDLNNDGYVDGFVAGCCYGFGKNSLVTSAYIPSSTWVWINEWNPGGWLVRHTLGLDELDGLPVRAGALGDLDGDGDLDVFAVIGAPTIGVSNSLDNLILLNDGSGNFTASDQPLSNAESTAVALGDLDGDNDLDVLVGTGNGAILWINQGGRQGGREGLFTFSEQELPGNQTRAIFLADLDGDGDLDALIAEPQQAIIWWNSGQAVFMQSSQYFRYSDQQDLAIGDFNGDDWLDIFVGTDTEYNVWLNQGDGMFGAK